MLPRGENDVNRNAIRLLAGLTILSAGCMLTPSYTRPGTPVAGHWPNGPAAAAAAASPGAAAAAGLDWREFLTDATLREVVALALANNRDLRLASLNAEMARALYGVQRDELYPSFHASGGAAKQRASGDLTAAGQPRTTEKYDISLGLLSWEIDFFGRIRNLKDQALERYLGTEQARRSAQILLVSGVANGYLALAADQEALALAERTFQAQKASYELVQRQVEQKVATELDLRRAQTPLEVARRDIALYTQRVAQDENALTLLIGIPLPPELRPADLGRISPPKALAAGLSSEVLLQRPDILAAEHDLRAANAFIGAARAAFFPSISLTTAIGTASDDLSGLFGSQSDTWSFAPRLAMPVFDARTWSAYRVSKVQRELAVAQYEKAIQSAFREVADALAVRGTVDQQVAAQQALVEALAETHRLASLRFEKGIDSYLGVLDAQRSLFAAQQALVALRLIQFTSQVRLYAVLGGGGPPDPT